MAWLPPELDVGEEPELRPPEFELDDEPEFVELDPEELEPVEPELVPDELLPDELEPELAEDEPVEVELDPESSTGPCSGRVPWRRWPGGSRRRGVLCSCISFCGHVLGNPCTNLLGHL